jgi:hypothetical protein
MTGGQDNPANGRDIHGDEPRRGSTSRSCRGARRQEGAHHVVDPYELPVLFKTVREETKIDDVSVIITDRPCVLIEDFKPFKPYVVHRGQVHRLRQLPRRRLPGHPRHRRDQGGEALGQGSRPRLRAHRASPAPAAACACSPARRRPSCIRCRSCRSSLVKASEEFHESDITNILVCGIGGQGVMTATEILAEAAIASATTSRRPKSPA